MKKFILSLITFLFFAGVLVFAGSLTPDNPPTTTGHSIADIYALIEGTTPPTPSLSPSVSTSEATMHSISELYVTLANLIQADKLDSTSVIYLGVTGGTGESTPEPLATITKEFSPTSEAGTVTGFTLLDIDNLINNTRVTTPTHSDFAPASTPADSGPTLDEIYTSLSTLITASDIATGTTYLGVLGTYEAEPVPTYTVTFDSQGGSEVSPIGGIQSGETIILPTEPTREYYTFSGWYSEINGGGVEFINDESIVDSDITVYAKWTTNFDKIVSGEGDYNGSSPNGGYTYNGDDLYGPTYIGPLINPGLPFSENYYIAYWGDGQTGAWYVGEYADTLWDRRYGEVNVNGVYTPREGRTTGEVIVSDP